MTQDEIKALIEDLRLNHEFCPQEVILQAADQLERMQQGIETLHALYEQAVKQRDYLMDQQRAQVEAIKKRSFSDDVGRLLSTGKGFYDDGTPIDYKEVQLEIKGVSDGVFECTAVRIPRPPKREWVSLTDEEIKEIIGPWGETPVKGYTRKLFDQIEAKLKEKNT